MASPRPEDADQHSPSGPSRDPAAANRRRMTTDWLLWLALRLFVIGIIAGLVAWPEQINDLSIYAAWVDNSLALGQFPTDEMWQYPPLAGPVMLLGAGLPGDAIGFTILFLCFDAAIMVMLSHQAWHSRRPGGVRLWALLPLLVGPLVLARFDVVPTALAVAAVLTAASRAGLSGALAGVGAWLKVWPLLVLTALRRADLWRAALGVAAASLVIGGTLLATTTDPLSFLTGQRDRGLQIESVPAWPYLVARELGAPVEVVYRYGAHEVQATGVGVIAQAAALSTIALLAVVVVQRLRGALDGVSGADVALAAVLFSVATSRVFSGQYFIWLLALGAVCLGDAATRMRRTVLLLIAASAATHLVYPWLYSALLDGNPLAVAVQTVRVGLTVAATAGALLLVVRPSPPDPQLPRSGAS